MIKNDNNNNNYNQASRAAVKRTESSLKKGDTISVLFVGVGGQGIILATTIVANTVINAGFDVKVSEVHGMAQRGGSVEGSVRFGKKVYSPTINKAEFIVALEKLEALRFLPKLGSGGSIIVNNYEIFPSPVFSKGISYPDDIESRIEKQVPNCFFADAVEIARSLKEIRVSNVVLLGIFSNFLPFENDFWTDAIKGSVPRKAMSLNIEAFNRGKYLF